MDGPAFKEFIIWLEGRQPWQWGQEPSQVVGVQWAFLPGTGTQRLVAEAQGGCVAPGQAQESPSVSVLLPLLRFSEAALSLLPCSLPPSWPRPWTCLSGRC